MTQQRVVSIGECMIEMSGDPDGGYRLGYAGDTFNTAWYMRALLGMSWSVDYFTCLGEDKYSAKILAFLNENHIGTGYIRTVPGRRPGLYVIHQDKGDRHFTYWRDTSAAKLLADDRNAIEAAVRGASLVYFSGITLAILSPPARDVLLEVIAEARVNGAKVAFDTNVRPDLWSTTSKMASVLRTAAGLCDIALPTHADEAPVFGSTSPDDTADRYLELGVKEVVVKNGAAAAIVATANQRMRVPAEFDVKAVDPTGAGDSFNGAYLAARLAGKSLLSAAEDGHRLASIVIGQRGALVAPSQKLTP